MSSVPIVDIHSQLFDFKLHGTPTIGTNWGVVMKKRVHVSFSVQVDGLMRTECISTTEDLWHDFLYFKAKSNDLTSPSETMLRLRYLRAAVSALYAYVEGVVNQWCAELHADPAFGQRAFGDFVHRRDPQKKKKARTIEGFIRHI